MLLSPERAGRPRDVDDPWGAGGHCPFCPGHEAQTAAQTGVAPGDGGWRARAFVNRFPAVGPGLGVHEIVVNSPRHVDRLHALTPAEAAAAVGLWADRLAATARDPRELWPTLFLNQGAAAGASIAHTHAQVVGLPVAAPRVAARERAVAEADGCIVCDQLADAGDRIVRERDGLVAWCPEVQPLAGGVRLAPADHVPGWDAGLDPAAVGAAVVGLAALIDAAHGGALNLWLSQRRPGGDARHHWHIDLVPRIAVVGGCELGTGLVAVAGSPRDDAARLRALGQPAAGSRTTPATR